MKERHLREVRSLPLFPLSTRLSRGRVKNGEVIDDQGPHAATPEGILPEHRPARTAVDRLFHGHFRPADRHGRPDLRADGPVLPANDRPTPGLHCRRRAMRGSSEPLFRRSAGRQTPHRRDLRGLQSPSDWPPSSAPKHAGADRGEHLGVPLTARDRVTAIPRPTSSGATAHGTSPHARFQALRTRPAPTSRTR